MKLYYSPGACSLSAHIVAKEAGLPLSIVKVDLKAKVTETGGNYREISPKGYVPALQLDNGKVLTEAGAVLEYLADLAPQAHLTPANGSFERAEMRAWLYFTASELHKSFGPLWNPSSSEDARKAAGVRLNGQFALLEGALADGRTYLLGSAYTVADAYCYVIMSFAAYFKMDLSAYPKLKTYLAKVGERPAVKEARVEEGLPPSVAW